MWISQARDVAYTTLVNSSFPITGAKNVSTMDVISTVISVPVSGHTPSGELVVVITTVFDMLSLL